MLDWFFSPEYSKVLFYILIGFVVVFLLFRKFPAAKDFIEAKIISFRKKGDK